MHGGADADRRRLPRGGVADRLVDGDVGAGLDGRRKARSVTSSKLTVSGASVGERRERRLQAGLGQHGGVDAVRELAQLGERAVDLVADVAEPLAERALRSGAGQAQVEDDGQQALLRAVVEVAFQASPGLVRRRDDARPRVTQLLELGEHLGAQRLVLDRQPRRGAEEALELAAGKRGGLVEDDGQQATAARDPRRRPGRSSAQRTVGVHEAAGCGNPVEDVEGGVAQRRCRAPP